MLNLIIHWQSSPILNSVNERLKARKLKLRGQKRRTNKKYIWGEKKTTSNFCRRNTYWLLWRTYFKTRRNKAKTFIPRQVSWNMMNELIKVLKKLCIFQVILTEWECIFIFARGFLTFSLSCRKECINIFIPIVYATANNVQKIPSLFSPLT